MVNNIEAPMHSSLKQIASEIREYNRSNVSFGKDLLFIILAQQNITHQPINQDQYNDQIEEQKMQIEDYGTTVKMDGKHNQKLD